MLNYFNYLRKYSKNDFYIFEKNIIERKSQIWIDKTDFIDRWLEKKMIII